MAHTQQIEDTQNQGIGFAYAGACNDLERTMRMVHDSKLFRLGRFCRNGCPGR